MATKTPYSEAVPSYGERDTVQQIGPQIGGLRIAKITYDHMPVHASNSHGMTLGQLIDHHINITINKGELINEVSLFFETAEQQHQIAEMYRNK